MFSRIWLILSMMILLAIVLFLNIFPRYHTKYNYSSSKHKGASTINHVKKKPAVSEKPLFFDEGEPMGACETIHIGIVCAGYKSNHLLHTLLKSIYFHRVNPIHFHIIVNKVSENILGTLFDTWNVPKVNVTFYDLNDFVGDVKWIPNSHYSGIFGLLKLVFPKIIPPHVANKLIVFDTDLILLSDIYELWMQFRSFNKSQAIGIVENQSDFYLTKGPNSIPWPVIGRGYNSGVLLYKLDAMQSLDWQKMWSNITKHMISSYGYLRLADQDVINGIIKDHPELLFQVPCYWNTQLSDNTLSYNCYKNHKVKIVHWNSPRKLKVKNRDGDYFLSLFTTFLEYNGNLLRKQLQLCDSLPETIQNESDNVCTEFYMPVSTRWRTLLYFREFKSVPVENDVTFVAQLSYDRLQTIEELVKLWPGPISLTLYVSDPELNKCITFIQNSNTLKDRLNVAYHAVFKEGDYYPINTLRNVGLKNVNTPYVFLADIDFLPMKGLYAVLRGYIQIIKKLDKKALIVPAFELENYNSKVPTTKIQLLDQLKLNTIRPFLDSIWTHGHAPTDYDKWKSALEPYKVNWQPDFEPYVVVSSNVVRYDERFMGFGWNKVSHIMELEAQDYEFIVLPNSFIVHKPHAPSYDIARFRTSYTYRTCLQILKEDFIQNLNRHYGKNFEYKNSSITFESRRRKRNYLVNNTTEETNTDYPFLM